MSLSLFERTVVVIFTTVVLIHFLNLKGRISDVPVANSNVKKQEVISIMQDQYCEIFGKEPPPTDDNLMSPKLGNYIIDYLY